MKTSYGSPFAPILSAARLLGPCCMAAVPVILQAPAARAQTIDLYNTGVDATGTPLSTGGALDTHYTNGVSGSTYTSNAGNYYQFPDADYITIDQSGGNGFYMVTFDTTFSLPADADLSSVSIQGNWDIDNTGDDILINGHSTGIAVPGSSLSNFGVPHPFTLPTGYYTTGLNTLGFEWTNAGYIGGIAVEFTTKSYSVAMTTTPEPGNFALLSGMGLTGVTFLHGRRVRRTWR